MIERILSYPLRPAPLTAGLVFYAVLGFLFAAYNFSYGLEAAFGDVWLACSAIAVLVYTGLLVDYGMEILRATAEGQRNPPVFSGSITSIAEASRRCLRLILLLGLFAAAARQLHSLGWVEAEWTVWIALFLLLPAFLTNNTLYDRIFTMLNPAALWTTARNLGWVNVPVLGLLALVVALVWICLANSTGKFLLLFPLVLYCHFLCFHVLGLRVCARKDEFLAQVDFRANREQTQAVSANLAELNVELSQAHEWLRAGQHARVLEKLDAMLRHSSWENFEQLFGYTSQWFDTGPAVYLCRLYLDNPQAIGKPMRALELAQWALTREPGFTPTRDDHLQTLADGATIAAQYRTVLHLIENHLTSHPASPQRAALGQLALRLAGENLKDEVLYARLQAAVSNAN